MADADIERVAEVVAFQAAACAQSGSPLYGRVLEAVEQDLRAGGVTARLLGGRNGGAPALITVACHEDLTGSDLVGRYLIRGDDTVWIDGPLTQAAKLGSICYLDEVVEARKDTTVLIHPLTDHRRILPIDKKGEILEAHPDFLLVISYNPGYQSVLKDLKHSTRQRFVAIDFGYPPRDVEAQVIAHESGVDARHALQLATLGEKIRHLATGGAGEGVSTRLLVYAGQLIRLGRRHGGALELEHGALLVAGLRQRFPEQAVRGEALHVGEQRDVLTFDDGGDELVLVGEAPVNGGAADLRATGDVVEGDLAEPMLFELDDCGVEDGFGGGVSAGHNPLERTCCSAGSLADDPTPSSPAGTATTPRNAGIGAPGGRSTAVRACRVSAAACPRW